MEMPVSLSLPLAKNAIKRLIPPRSGTAFDLETGDLLAVTDPEGGQVADLFFYDKWNAHDTYSAGRTIDENDTIRLTKGHTLYSHAGTAMLEILEDTCGTHDALITPCSPNMFADPTHPSCEKNLVRALEKFGVDGTRVSTAFNVFMNVSVSETGAIKINPPLSKAGDFVLFRALRPLIVGLTACSDEGTNGGSCKPIVYEIRTNGTFS